VDKLTFDSDSENYDVPPPRKGGTTLVRANTNTSPPKLLRSNTKTSQKPSGLDRSDTQVTKKSVASRWGYGWGIGRSKEKGRAWDNDRESTDRRQSSDTRIMPHPSVTRHSSRSSKNTQQSWGSNNSRNTRRSSNDSTATLVDSALRRKEGYVEPSRVKLNTTERIEGLRKLMQKDNLDY
jgi:Xaa-Pro aminopeptidase